MTPKVNSERWLDTNNLPHEEWRLFHTAFNESKYLASNYGRVKLVTRYGREKILREYPNSRGYWRVKVEETNLFVHRIVAILFVKRGLIGYNEIDHYNNDKEDNRARNLHWVTHKKNINNPVSVWDRNDRKTPQTLTDRPKARRTCFFLPKEKGERLAWLEISFPIRKALFKKRGLCE